MTKYMHVQVYTCMFKRKEGGEGFWNEIERERERERAGERGRYGGRRERGGEGGRKDGRR